MRVYFLAVSFHHQTTTFRIKKTHENPLPLPHSDGASAAPCRLGTLSMKFSHILAGFAAPGRRMPQVTHFVTARVVDDASSGLHQTLWIHIYRTSEGNWTLLAP